MKKAAIALWVLGCFLMLHACATGPKLPDPKPGLYVNEAFAFTFGYPEMFTEEALQSDNEVLRVAYPNQWKIPVIAVAVADKQSDELSAQGYMDAVKASSPGSNRFKILSEKDMTLNDGTPAKSFTFKWGWTDGVTKLQSGALVANRGDKTFSCSATTLLDGDTPPEMLQAMCEAWTFY